MKELGGADGSNTRVTDAARRVVKKIAVKKLYRGLTRSGTETRASPVKNSSRQR